MCFSLNRSALETHLKVHTGVKEWECSTCSRKVISKEALWRHNQVFHQDEKPYECTECGRKFKCRDHLKKHSTKHGERQYKCEVNFSFFYMGESFQDYSGIHGLEGNFLLKIQDFEADFLKSASKS